MALIHGPLGQALGFAGRALTPDRYEEPQRTLMFPQGRQSLADYLRETAGQFDPRTPSGAFNLATTFLPGYGGRISPAQKALLKSIHESSYGRSGPSYNITHPKTSEASGFVGRPADIQSPGYIPGVRYANRTPLQAIVDQVGPFAAGLSHGGSPSRWSTKQAHFPNTSEMDLVQNMDLLVEILRRSGHYPG